MFILPVADVLAQRSSEGERLVERTADIPQDFKEQGEMISEQFADRFEDGAGALGQPGSIGEDILFNIREYQPQPLRSSLLEDQGANVFAILQGKPTNPAITIPEIKSVSIRRQKITTSPAGAPVSIGRVRYLKPASNILTYENLGYLVIPIRPIPKENDVPDEIIVDLEAQVAFDISEGLLFGPMKDVLMEQNHEQWTLTRDDHSFYAGYIRVSEIKQDQAVVHVYDNNGNEVRGSPLSLRVGQTSRSLNARAEFGYTKTGTIFDRFTLKLDNIQSLTDKAKFLITRDGKTQYTVATEGEALYPGSSWSIENIITDPLGEDVTVKLRNKNAGSTLDENVKELKAKKLQIDPQTGAKKTATGTTPSTTDASLEEYKKILAEYNTKQKENKVESLGYVSYADIIEKLKNVHATTTTSSETKTLTENLLKTIQRYYNTKRVEKQLTENRGEVSQVKDQIETDYQQVTAIVDDIEKDKTKLPSATKTTPTDLSAAAYLQARDEYQNLIDEFSASEDKEVRKKVAGAHWRIATMPLDAVRKETRQYHLETLLNEFEQEEYRAYTTESNVKKLQKLLETLEYDLQSVSLEITEPTTGEVFSVVLVGTEKAPEHLKSAATVTLDGAQTNKYEEGIELQWPSMTGDEARTRWIVREINDNSITISHQDGTNAVSLIKNTETSVEIKKGVQGKIKLVDTQVHKEAHITVSPVVERAISEAFFTIHLPIEKRAFDLPLFSDTVEEEIAKTEDLLAKLDEILKNVRTITEYWKKFCLITFGVLVVKNFFSGWVAGSTELRSRDRATDLFKERYQNCQSIEAGKEGSCAGKTYDQFIFEHESEYENTITQTAQIIDSKPADYNEKNFGKLGPEYNTAKEELYYYEEMHKRNPSDESIKTKYFAELTELKKAELDSSFADTYFAAGKIKSSSELKPDAIKTTLETPQMKESLKALYNDLPKEEREYIQSSPDPYSYVWDKYNARLISNYREKVTKDQMKPYIESLTTAPYNADDKTIQNLKESYRVDDIDTEALGTFQHSPKVSFAASGKGANNVQFISVDAVHYVQVSYTTGGRIQQYDLYRRTSPNGPMGHRSDVYLGVVDEQFLATYRGGKDSERQIIEGKLDHIRDCISRINKQQAQTKYGRGSKIATNAIGCGDLGKYVVEQSPVVSDASGPSCTEFMSPTDCKLLFNACDPVICPPSRCNLGGNWYVDNVVETGIIGSALLCAPNFIAFNPEGGVVMPVCLTGIHAGLQNIRSIIEGYRQCLITAKVQGTAVGVCDRIRSFGICEILWKEAIAIFDAKEGILKQLDKLFRGSSAAGSGGEYSAFSQSFDNSVKSVEYFTKSYAKNTFARYSGGSLNEIGTEICKAAIFRKAPGIGNFFDEITRPESPPQFNAFFDEAPYSDISDTPLSQYKIFYHIYAGENPGPGPVYYSVWMQAKDPYTNTYIYPPTFVQDGRGVIRGRRLAAGAFASGSPDVVMPAGMEEICIEVVTQTYGRKTECGFGKVSTGFALNYITDKFAQSEASKRVNSAAECVSKSSTFTEAISERGALAGAGVGAIGTVSSGFTSTGIVRKCSKESPGIGGNEEKWSPVGSCGTDDLGRDLGTCWLYIPAAKNVIREVAGRTTFSNTLNETAAKVIRDAEAAGKPIPGFYTTSKEEIEKKFSEAKDFIKKANDIKVKLTSSENPPKDEERPTLIAEALRNFMSAREKYNYLINAFDIDEPSHAEAQFLLAESYESEARLLLIRKPITPPPASTDPTKISTTEKNPRLVCTIKDAYWARLDGAKDTTKKEFIFAEDEDLYIILRSNNCINKEISLQFAYESSKYQREPGLRAGVFVPYDAPIGEKKTVSITKDFMLVHIEEDEKTILSGQKDKNLVFTIIGDRTGVLRPSNVLKMTESSQKCAITKAYWGDEKGNALENLQVFNGDKVTINLESINCADEDIIVSIKENSQKFEKEISAKMTEKKTSIDWTTEWVDDSFLIFFGGDPEYTFTILKKKDRSVLSEGEEKVWVKKEKNPILVCTIKDAYWARLDGAKDNTKKEFIFAEDEDLYIILRSNNCINKEISLQFAYESSKYQREPGLRAGVFVPYDAPIGEKKTVSITKDFMLVHIEEDEKTILSGQKDKNLVFTIIGDRTGVLRPSNVLKMTESSEKKSSQKCAVKDAYWAKIDGIKMTPIVQIAETEDITVIIDTANCVGNSFNLQFVQTKGSFFSKAIRIDGDKTQVSATTLAQEYGERNQLFSQWGKNILFAFYITTPTERVQSANQLTLVDTSNNP